ncbi:2-hydroxyglutaryl-CoA dehydratase [Agarilytica rhodophyticola]|uniref:2-hydroxyglutaryl-CoA dehydratase n=1 Tax=Agarilytica rhodophyticola TaxID=1737490 RepID=UPI000B3482E5|nr:2-hydroxyglutaryl-CoA dehydratase [Agarilytica rhodophyticola]
MRQTTDKQDAVQTLDPNAFLKNIDEQVLSFEEDERQRLGLDSETKEHWRDANPRKFTAQQRSSTTILHAGLTMAHDLFLQSTFRGLGYKVEAMEVPDNEALQFGREFGNRGQCNPTYFTVGNLIKKLKQLEASGIPKKEIVNNYLFATVGSCGPCRFGTYVTEYRKALRDAGFEGFRVLLVQQAGGIKQATGEELGLKINAQFFLSMVKAVIVGDILNALGYRIRPYEINPGQTEATLERAKARIAKAMETNKGLLRALLTSRKELQAIPVDRTQVKPKVAIIGEFWAMTTEGDGNYKMQSFLEQEGAEVDIQLAIAWPLYLMWCAKYDTEDRARLKGTDKGGDKGSKFALENVDVRKRLLMLKFGDKVVRALFYSYAKLLGLKNYKLPNMDEIAKISHKYYDNNLRGGEGHMEVGKLIQNVLHQKANMTLSIKPFGCMPSSAVSDGVQSLITELHPNAIFLPIETSGDGAVNVYSRVQMQLFKARQSAQKEVESALTKFGLSFEEFRNKIRTSRKYQNPLYKSPHKGACTSLDLVYDCASN